MRVEAVDLQAQAQTDLPAQFGATSVLAFTQGLNSRLQTVDDVARSFQPGFALPTAEGVQLDALGALASQPRLGGPYPLGEPDAIYRRKIYAAILRNRSGGTVPDLIKVIKALLAGLDPVVYYQPLYPASMNLTVTTSTALTADEMAVLVQFIAATKAAGVGANVYVVSNPTFAYATFPQPPYAGYNKGYWAHVFRL